jgi:hypothetical protein
VWFGCVALVWFVTALPVVALLWVIPPFPRAAVATVVVYLVALVVPLASPMVRYPLHVICSGHLPVVGSRFMGDRTYTAPGSPAYAVFIFDDYFFCPARRLRPRGSANDLSRAADY